MSHEIFAIEHASSLNEQQQGRIGYLRTQLAGAEKLELRAQVKSIQDDITSVEKGGLITTAPLSESELIIWRAWLPTVYTYNAAEPRRQLEQYDFDRVPMPVLKIWQKHKDAGTFENYEVWTPSRTQIDPILVGVNGNVRHLLARWGESDANLVSFGDIKRELERRTIREIKIWADGSIRFFGPFFGAIAGTLLSIVIAILFGYQKGDATLPWLLAILIPSCSLAGFILANRLYRIDLSQRIADDDLLRAIRTDDSRPREQLEASAV